METPTEKQDTVQARWDALLQEEPRIRIRDAAERLGLSEAELLVTRCGESVTRLQGDWRQLIRDLPLLGRVLCLTRNAHAVHERFGAFQPADFFHGMGQVAGPDIDLRLFMNSWCHGFAVNEQTPDGDRQSLQFFDAAGSAIHKIFLQEQSNYGAYGVILNKFRSPNQRAAIDVQPAAPAAPALPDAEVDVGGFQDGWRGLNDTHAFHPLLQRFRVTRVQALRLAPEGFASRLKVASIQAMLEEASRSGLSIMVFIGNRGCLQIHTGPVKNIRLFGSEWLNVLDPDFSMHLRIPALDSVWAVHKPTQDGMVSSLEAYDDRGDLIVQFFGQRKPGAPENETWRSLITRREGVQ